MLFDYLCDRTPAQLLTTGGYTYIAIDTWYVVDHYVPDSCLKQRSGSECVTLLLAQLDDGTSPPPPNGGNSNGPPGGAGGATGGSGSNSSNQTKVGGREDAGREERAWSGLAGQGSSGAHAGFRRAYTQQLNCRLVHMRRTVLRTLLCVFDLVACLRRMQVIVAVVVPVCGVLLLGALAALLLVRRRRRQQAERYGPGGKQPDGSGAGKGDVEAGSGAGSDPRVRAADQGCVFMGLDEDQDLPPWSGLGLEEHVSACACAGRKALEGPDL